MADLSLHDVRSKTLETTFLRKLEERTVKRETARADITQQTHKVARARHAEDAQVTRAAERRRSLDDEQRRREQPYPHLSFPHAVTFHACQHERAYYAQHRQRSQQYSQYFLQHLDRRR